MEGLTLGGILTWLVIGLIVGALAKLIMPGKDRGGILFTILLGVVGAFVGGFVGSLIGIGEGITTQGVNFGGFLLALVGAIVVLAIYRAVARRRTIR